MNAQPRTRAPRAVWFPDWFQVLEQTDLPESTQSQYRTALLEFLRFCKQTRQAATIPSARQFIRDRQAQRVLSEPDRVQWQEALNWFFREAGRRRHPPGDPTGHPPADSDARAGPVLTGVPTLGAADLGGAEWERLIIRELRTRHYAWRTEQAYREWAKRFVRWLEARGGRWEQAAHLEVKDFLTDLAVRQRASASAQKQALNALVFLLREALHRPLGDFGNFTRARKVMRVPVVLTRDECQRLFSAFEGVPRLMAELMYGSGLRLTELLCLRVKDLDLDRRQLIVRAGKGGRDRVTVLPELLVEQLRTHRERLRGLHTEDQRQDVPGVWLPEGLERKYPNAGKTWEWQTK